MNSFWLLLFIILTLSKKKNGYITVPNRPFWLIQRVNEFHYIFGISIYRFARVPQVTSFTTYKLQPLPFAPSNQFLVLQWFHPNHWGRFLLSFRYMSTFFLGLENAGILLFTNFCLGRWRKTFITFSQNEKFDSSKLL